MRRRPPQKRGGRETRNFRRLPLPHLHRSLRTGPHFDLNRTLSFQQVRTLRMELLPRRRPRYGLRHGLVMSRPAALATSPSCPAVLATSPGSAAEGRADSFLSLETPLLGGWGNTWNQRADMQGPRRCRSHPLAQQRRQQRPGCAAPAVLRVLRPHGVRPHARRRVSCGAGAAVQQVPPLLGAPVLLPAALLRPPPVCSLN